jgi:hypothetical protein
MGVRSNMAAWLVESAVNGSRRQPPAGHACRRHVADGHAHRVGTRLDTQLIGHLRRQLDPLHRKAPRGERQRDAAGPDAELDHRPAVGQLGEEVDHRAEDRGRDVVRRDAVVGLRQLSPT